MIKVKRKIVKKKKTEPETVKVETSTTSSTSSVFGKSIFKRLGHVICFRRTVVQWYDCLNPKGQLISKCLFGVFTFFQQNEQKQVDR